MRRLLRGAMLLALALVTTSLSPPVAAHASGSDLAQVLPSWCQANDATYGKTQYGGRFDACLVKVVPFEPGPDSSPWTPTVVLRTAVIAHTSPSSGAAGYTYYADAVGFSAPTGDSNGEPILIGAEAPKCGSGCVTAPQAFSVQELEPDVGWAGVVKFSFTVSRTVPSGSVLDAAVSLPLKVGQPTTAGNDGWFGTQSIPAPGARCDSALPGLTSTGCVFAQVTPAWKMDWAPSGVLDSNPGFPQVAAHVRDAQNRMGTQNQVLHRTDSARRDLNRKNACARVKGLSVPYSDASGLLLPGGYSCDEYPFASTEEGGLATTATGSAIGSPYIKSSYVVSGKVPPLNAQSKLSIAPLLNSQNMLQGSRLNSFYVANRILPSRGATVGDGFTVGFVSNPPAYVPPPAAAEPVNLDCKPIGTGASAAAREAVAQACAKVHNTPYTYGGGHGPYPGPTYGYYDGIDPASKNDGAVFGFDCSGLVRWAWYMATGQDFLDGSSQMQRDKLASTPSIGTRVTEATALPGDVMFFGGAGHVHHVAIYLGDNKVVEARQSGTPLMVSSLSTHDDFYEVYRPLVSGSGSGPTDAGGNAYVWATNVHVRASANTTSAIVSTLPGQSLVTVTCQAKGESVSLGTAVSDYWSKVPTAGGWVSNVFLRGGAVLTGIPACTGSSLPPPGGSGKFAVWAAGVRVRSAPASSAPAVATIATPRTVDVTCQTVGTPVSDSGYTSSYWSKIAEPAGYISNVYIRGLDKLDGVPLCSGSATPPTQDRYFHTWATSVHVRSAAATSASVVATITDPSTVNVVCQVAGQTVTDGGYTSSYWSRLAMPVGYVSNVYITGPAQLPNVPLC